MIVDLLYSLDFTVVCVEVCLVGKGTFYANTDFIARSFPSVCFC